MPATATGRGAQVLVDPGSDTAKAIRGAYAATLELNTAKVRADRLSGTFASGDTSSDGTTSTGGAATDPVTVPSSAPGVARTLYAGGASVGNGADTTEDLLMTYDVPANTLRNVGDTLRIFAAGTLGATTDSKTIRIKFGTVAIYTAVANTATTSRWAAQCYVTRTGASAQSYGAMSTLTGTATGNGVNAGTTGRIDTAPITLQVTGQNGTSSVAGSLTCQLLTVEYIAAPPS